MDIDATPQYSIWLLPASTQEQSLAETVARLSALLGGIAFTPHVTVQGDLGGKVERLQGLLEQLAAATPAQQWYVRKVETSPHFFRCLYLRFDAEPAFTDLQSAAGRFNGTEAGLSPFPHLSLVYGQDLAGTEDLREVLSGEFVGRSIVFDRLVLARSSKDVPIPDWQCLAQYALQAPVKK